MAKYSQQVNTKLSSEMAFSVSALSHAVDMLSFKVVSTITLCITE